jgi:hypothetical protein
VAWRADWAPRRWGQEWAASGRQVLRWGRVCLEVTLVGRRAHHYEHEGVRVQHLVVALEGQLQGYTQRLRSVGWLGRAGRCRMRG